MLSDQSGVHLPAQSKANLMTLGGGEGKYSALLQAPSKENMQQETQTPWQVSEKGI